MYDNFIQRTMLLIGEHNVNKLQHSHIAIFGVGGVGSVLVECLVRSGIGQITIIDNKKISDTNKNRQIMADDETIGKYKVDALETRIKKINNNCIVNKQYIFYNINNSSSIDYKKFDYIIDAIDSVDSKVELIKQSNKHNIKIISSMSAGNKLDIFNFKIDNLENTKYCKLAKHIRHQLKEYKLNNLKVVYSTEKNVVNIINNKEIPTMIFTPWIVGLIMAEEVILDLIKS